MASRATTQPSAGWPLARPSLWAQPISLPTFSKQDETDMAEITTRSNPVHGEVWSCVRLLLSIPLVQLRAAQKPKARRARFRARSGYAALTGIDSASLRSPLALYETNVLLSALNAGNPENQ